MAENFSFSGKSRPKIVMITHLVSPLVIEKTAEDSYRFMLKGTYRQIDETVNGPQLLAMLSRELIEFNGVPLLPEMVFDKLDKLPIGKGIELSVIERVG